MTRNQFSNLIKFVFLISKNYSGTFLNNHSPNYIIEKWKALVNVVPSVEMDDYSDNVLKWYNLWRDTHDSLILVYPHVFNVVSFIDDLNTKGSDRSPNVIGYLSPQDIISCFEKRIGNFNFGNVYACSLHPNLLRLFERFMEENVREINLILLTNESNNSG